MKSEQQIYFFPFYVVPGTVVEGLGRGLPRLAGHGQAVSLPLRRGQATRGLRARNPSFRFVVICRRPRSN